MTSVLLAASCTYNEAELRGVDAQLDHRVDQSSNAEAPDGAADARDAPVDTGADTTADTADASDRAEPADAVDSGDADGPPTCDEVTGAGCMPAMKCGFSCDLGFHCMASGSGRDGDVCALPDAGIKDDRDCAPGFACIGVGTMGTCYRYCHSDSDCMTGHTCVAFGANPGCDRSDRKFCP